MEVLNSSLHNKAKLCLLISSGFSAITIKSLGISEKVIILNQNVLIISSVSKVLEDKEMKDPYEKKEIPTTKLHNAAHLGIHIQN